MTIKVAVQGLLGIWGIGLLSGCAVVQSQAIVSQKPGGFSAVRTPSGIPYFLPKRPFVITVSEPANGGVPMIAVGPGIAEPELSERYVLSQGTNLLADNEFNVGVSARGLLTSSTSNATSQVATTFQNIAATVGMFAAGGAAPNPALLDAKVDVLVNNNAAHQPPPPTPQPTNIACPVAGASYQIIIYPEASPTKHPITLCDTPEGGPYSVKWHRADQSEGGPAAFGGNNKHADSKTPVSGLFFRHELPYLVSIGGPPGHATRNDTVITSPDESETDFFPVKRSFFANNTGAITVTDGVITSVDQTTKSEFAAATALPAEVVSSYMSGIGQLLSGLSANSADQQKLVQQMLATSATQSQGAAVNAVQNRLCAKTIASYNFNSLSPADLAAALTNIKAACPAG